MQDFSQSKKILYLVTQGNWGGAQKYVFDLAVNLRTYRVTVASGQESQLLSQKLEQANIKYYPVKHLVRKIQPLKDLLALIEIYRLMKREQPDIVHLNSSKAGVLGSIAAKLAGVKKVVFTMHGLVLNEPANPLKRSLYFLGEKLSSYFKDKIIAVSEADKRSAIRYRLKKASDIAVIHNGLDFQNLEFLTREAAREKLAPFTQNELRNKKIIGTIADFYATKGLEFLIAAARAIIKKQKQVTFILMGRSGPEEKKIESLLKKANLESNFLLIKNLNNAAAYLKAFDLFVLPSVKEGFPYTILEAMAAGVPIIACRVGGIPEILTHEQTALLVAPKNALALQTAIQKCIHDEAFSRQIAAAAKDLTKEFSLAKMIAQTRQIYEEPPQP